MILVMALGILVTPSDPAPHLSSLESILAQVAPLLLVFGVVALVIRARRPPQIPAASGVPMSAAAVWIECPNCKYAGAGRFSRRGSGAIELLLWLAACLPGLIYTIWRSSGQPYACPRCGWRHVIGRAMPAPVPSPTRLTASNSQAREN